MSLSNFSLKPLHIAMLTLIGLIPWLLVQMEMALNTNHAWLFTAAMRLLDGGNHLRDVYEPNPPLSIILYYPPVLMSRYLSIPAEYSMYVFGVLTLLFSTWALWLFLKPLEAISRIEKSLYCAIYVISGCVIPSNLFFAERDEFVVWGLVPFMLAQLMITKGHEFKGTKYHLILFFCALMIIVKPHYIIFPALLFLHRIVVKPDRLAMLRQADMGAMALACMLYTSTVLVFFQDYLNVVLPDFIKYYIGYPSDGIMMAFVEKAILCAILLAGAGFLPIERIYKRIGIGLIFSAGLALVLYAVQMKGFGYHLVPGKMFIYLAAMALAYGVLHFFVKREGPRAILALAMGLGVAYAAVPLKIHSQTHASYQELLLPQTVAACGSPCPFFIFTENMEMIWQTSIYTGEEHASRFPGLWWLHSMLEKGHTPEEVQKYGEMIAEDLARYDPKILMIAANLQTVHGDTFKMIEFFSANENFKKQIGRYKLDKSIVDDRGSYFKGTTGEYGFPIEYDIYLRQK